MSKELDDEQYQARLDELNNNAENKHYAVFWSPASGKTWIIGSILHYMKSYIEGTAHLDTSKTTESEEELFYLLQDRFNRVTGSQKIVLIQRNILSYIFLLNLKIPVNLK